MPEAPSLRPGASGAASILTVSTSAGTEAPERVPLGSRGLGSGAEGLQGGRLSPGTVSSALLPAALRRGPGPRTAGVERVSVRKPGLPLALFTLLGLLGRVSGCEPGSDRRDVEQTHCLWRADPFHAQAAGRATLHRGTEALVLTWGHLSRPRMHTAPAQVPRHQVDEGGAGSRA